MDHGSGFVVFEVAFIVLVMLGVQALGLKIKILRNIPAAPKLMVAGMLITSVTMIGSNLGVHAFEMIVGIALITHLAEFGVGARLLNAGIEFSLDELKKDWRTIIIGGSLQMGITAVLAGFACLQVLEHDTSKAIFVGLTAGMSSTILVLDRLVEAKKLHSRGGHLTYGELIFQDLALLPLALMIPVFTGGDSSIASILLLLARGVIAIAVTLVVEFYVAKPLFDRLVKTGRRDMLYMGVVAFTLIPVGVCMWVELSPVLGCFLAGVLISSTKGSASVRALVEPFELLLLPLFFVSMGMLFDIGFFVQNLPLLLASIVGLVVIKFIGAATTAMFFGLTSCESVRVGAVMAHVGELSFVLVALAVSDRFGLLSQEDYKAFVCIAIGTMMLNYVSIAIGQRVSAWVPEFRLYKPQTRVLGNGENGKQPHVIVVGYGEYGRIIAKAFSLRKTPVVVIEKNGERATLAQEDGHVAVLNMSGMCQAAIEEAGIDNALLVVLAFDHHGDLHQATQTVRRLDGEIPIFVRAHTVADQVDLQDSGGRNLHIVSQVQLAARHSLSPALRILRLPPLEVRDTDAIVEQMTREAREAG